jgi:hypothetical protein
MQRAEPKMQMRGPKMQMRGPKMQIGNFPYPVGTIAQNAVFRDGSYLKLSGSYPNLLRRFRVARGLDVIKFREEKLEMGAVSWQ